MPARSSRAGRASPAADGTSLALNDQLAAYRRYGIKMSRPILHTARSPTTDHSVVGTASESTD